MGIYIFALALASVLALICHPPAPARAELSSGCPPPAGAVGESPAAAPKPTPSEIVIACVGAQPISEAMFLHWHEVATATEPGSKGHRPSAQEAIVQAMGFLISGDWVLGEAQALGIHVTPAVVRKQFESIRKQQFPKLREFQAFLRQSKETVADLLLRVELDMLSSRIQRRVTAGHRRPGGQMHAMERFVSRFKRKWTAQTYCAAPYAMRDCGHVQTSL